MTKISAKVIADSKNEFGDRITTMIVTFPRFILAELNTHRMMSRNSASSRAIPFEKMLHTIENDPFVPIAFQKEHKGMQGTQYLEGDELNDVLHAYGRSIDNAIIKAKEFAATGVTKQLANRQLEAYMWHTVIITATEWENFFALRCPRYIRVHGKGETEYRSRKDFSYAETDGGAMMAQGRSELDWLKLNRGQAEIHMMALAEEMWDAINESTPKELKAGQWHIPYEDKIDYSKFNQVMDMSSVEGKTPQEVAVMISCVMCARVSYTTIDSEQSEWDYKKYINKHDELSDAEPLHASPFEHCGQAMDEFERNRAVRGIISSSRGSTDKDGTMLSIDNLSEICGWSGNFRGFKQYRKSFRNENITK